MNFYTVKHYEELFKINFFKKKLKQEIRKMAQRLRGLAVLLEDLSSISGSHMMAHYHL